MKKSSQPFRKIIISVSRKLFHRGTIFSALMVVMSLLSDLGTQLTNKLGGGASTVQAGRDLLPYESPSFHIFDGIFVNDAKATTINVATML